MKTLNQIRIATIVLSAIVGANLLSGCAVQESQETEGRVGARIAVIVDESKSFEENWGTASGIVAQFIRENALSGDTEVYLIAMDREPRVIDVYAAEQLLDADGNKALEDMKSSVNPLDGTDVVGALRLATMKLLKKTETKPSKLILLCFSDMHVDRATTPVRKEFSALSQMDWKQLKDNNVDCRFYFVSAKVESELIAITTGDGLDATIKDAKESSRLVLGEIGDSAQ